MSKDVEHHIHESPPAMTGVLIVLAVLSAIGGFLALPHFLAPLLPLPEAVPALEHFETPLVAVSIVLALTGLAGAAFVYGGDGARAERLQHRFANLHRLLTAKYFVDEAYDALIARPLYWISDRVLLGYGDRKVIDGTLHGLAAMGRRTAGGLSRVQNGSLQLYALLVVIGLVASLAWGLRHG